MKNSLALIVYFIGAAAFAQSHGMHVDVNSFMDSTNDMIVNIGNRTALGAVVLTCIGLMIPGFREVTKRNLVWIVIGVLGIILVTRYWR